METKKTQKQISPLVKVRQEVAQQYEKHPYPNIPWIAFPKIAEAHTLAYEFGQFLRTGYTLHHSSATRILVAGSGALEPIVVAKAHPKAQIFAVDLSAASLLKLKNKVRLSKLTHRVHCIQADLHSELPSNLGRFDYIICTGVLHHSPQPKLFMEKLANLLLPHGIVRLMAYPEISRIWIYETSKYFNAIGLNPNEKNLLSQARKAIRKLEENHPIRLAFETYSDGTKTAGLIDGFFHAYDQPLATEDFYRICESIDFKLLGFGHAWHSQPAAFNRALQQNVEKNKKLIKKFSVLSPWERLALLDHCTELSINPVYWLAPKPQKVHRNLPKFGQLNPVLKLTSKILTGKKIKAPLMPLKDFSSTSSPYRFEPCDQKKAMNDPKRFKDWMEGGWLLGNEGTLPPGLFENRDHGSPSFEPKKHSSIPDEVFLDFKKLFADELPEQLEPNQRIIPSPVRAKLMAALRKVFESFDYHPDLVEFLANSLEPRVDLKGRDIPNFTVGDLLRDLIRRGFSSELILQIIHEFPKPVAEKMDLHRIINGANKWFLVVEKKN